MGEKVIVERDHEAVRQSRTSLASDSVIHTGGVYQFKQHVYQGHTKDSSYLVVPSLLELQSQISVGKLAVSSFASKLLGIFSESFLGETISRVCLTHNPVFSRKLSIVSSANLDSHGLEDLVPGYSCYVAPSSSLFPRGNGNVNAAVRTYSDINSIVGAFKSANRPTQRTIQKLYNSGIRSGLSLSIDFGIQGGCVLFVNSSQVSAFDNWDVQDFLSINVLRMVVYSAFKSFLDNGSVLPLPQEIVIDKKGVSSVFSAQQFAMSLEREIEQNLGIRPRIEFMSHLERRFFVPTQTVLFLIVALLKNIERSCDESFLALNLGLHTIEQDSKILFSIRGGLELKSSAHVCSIEQIASRSDIKIITTESGFDLSVPCASASQQETKYDYSTA